MKGVFVPPGAWIARAEFASIGELAAREGIAPSYMTRVMRQILLAPDTVEAILTGTQRPELTLARVLEQFPVEWAKEGAALIASCSARV